MKLFSQVTAGIQGISRESSMPIFEDKRKKPTDTLSKTDIITPEIASKVVSQYILPMFENDGKKELKKKYNKLKGVVQQKNNSSKFKLSDAENGEKPTVYGELKLIESLNNEVKC